MPMIAKLPMNAAYIKNFGTYPTHLNVLDRKKTAVQRQIRRGGLGSYEPEFQASLLALCEVTESPLSFYDVGAHISLYSALVSTVFRRKNPYVLAVEPTPNTAAMARQLRDKNELAYTILEAAVSDTHGQIELFISDKAETSNSLNSEFRESSQVVTVELLTIDRIVDRGFVPPKIMKIDVETLEAHVIRGALGTIMNYRPVITLEILKSAELVFLEAMLRALEGFGYTFYRVEERNDDWVAVNASDAIKKVSNAHRDWVCTPSPLDKGFFEARLNWLSALAACDKRTNVMIEGGQRIPDKYFHEY